MAAANRTIWLWGGLALAVVLIVALGLYFVSQSGQTVLGPGVLSLEANRDDHAVGLAGAPLTLVEYSDFECPACAAYFPVVEKLLAEFPQDLRLIYRHFPLPQHSGAMPAALAAEAAAEQGKFWEMAGLIFANQSAWSGRANAAAAFRDYAGQLGLDLARYDVDVRSSQAEAKITSQRQSGVNSAVNSTPTFYLNGQKIANPRSYEEFSNLIKAELGR